MKILVVFDERAIADDIAGLLRREDHQALPVYSAADALQHLKHLWFDLVILRDAQLMDRILANLIHPKAMLLEVSMTLENLPTRVKEVERQLEVERQQVLEFLQRDYEESEPCTSDQ